MYKICVMIMSRSNYGRLESVIKEIDENPLLELQIVTGCSADLSNTPYTPNFSLGGLVSGDDVEAMSITTGLLITRLSVAVGFLEPDLILVHGDRYEILACATVASYHNISLAHTEGGEHTGTIDEKVRYAITSLADLHFPVTGDALVNILAMGKKNVYKVGSPSLDLINDMNLERDRFYKYIVVLYHPNTTDPEDIESLVANIEDLEETDIKVIWVNPNVDAGSKKIIQRIHTLSNVKFIKNLNVEEYLRLIRNSVMLIGNTSSGIKEGAYLGVPYVCVGKRQGEREHGNNTIFVDNNYEDILFGINIMSHYKFKRNLMFGNGTAAYKIVEHIIDYLEV